MDMDQLMIAVLLVMMVVSTDGLYPDCVYCSDGE